MRPITPAAARGKGAPRPALRVLGSPGQASTRPLRQGDRRPGWSARLRTVAPRLGAAWRHLERWEQTAADELDEEVLGDLIVLIWCVHRLGSCGTLSAAALDELLDDDLHPTFATGLLEDVAAAAFSLGAAWADARRHSSDGPASPRLELMAGDGDTATSERPQ